MNLIKQTLISFSITLAVLLGVYYYFPFWVVSVAGGDMLGTTVTTINGSDTIKNSRTTINDNFTALNNGKIEVSTTTLLQLTTATNLSAIGTITTGTWNANILTVQYGGTGSSTLTSNEVLLGNGTSGVKTVLGYGTSGQFLTSNGAGNAPTWQTSSINEAGDYTWTGSSTFSRTPIIPNAPVYTTDGTNKAYVDGFFNKLKATTTNAVNVSGTDEKSMASTTIPASALGAGGVVHARINVSALVGNGSTYIVLRVKYDDTYIASSTIKVTQSGYNGYIDAYLYEAGTASSQEGTISGLFTIPQVEATNGYTMYFYNSGTGAEDSTTAKVMDVTLQGTAGDNSFTVDNWYFEIAK